jgi:hypothetical protein
MKRIDSPTDVALTQYEGEPGDTVREIMLKIAGNLHNPVGLALAIKNHFSSKTRFERIGQVFLAFNHKIECLEKECKENKVKAEAIEDRTKSPQFVEAFVAAAEEAVRTADSRKLDRLANVLANGADPDTLQPDDDLSSFVRDVAQLSESDINTLDSIAQALQLQLWLRENAENTSDLPMAEDFLEGTALQKLETNDFYSTAYRLVGFGLALELPTKTGRRSSNNIRFTTTRRGRKLLQLLKTRT